MIKQLPAQNAKFIAALVYGFIAYMQLYGPTWHATAAYVILGGALGVWGVPNSQPAGWVYMRPVQAPVTPPTIPAQGPPKL